MVAAGALIHRQGKEVLLVRRNRPPNRGKWAFPGGLVELGETVQEAVRREVREEVGLEVSLEGVLDAVTDLHVDRKRKVKYHYVIIDYIARPLGGEITLNAESSEYGWFAPGIIIKSMDVSVNTRECIRKFRRLVRSRSLAGP